MFSHKLISEKELKYFIYNFKKPTNLRKYSSENIIQKIYFLPRIHKRRSAVPGRWVISNCDTPIEKMSEYLDYILKPMMQDSWLHVKDSGDFLKKIKNIGKIPEGAILVKADVIGLYLSISHEAGLEALWKRLIERESPKALTEDIVQVAEFALKNNFFEFNGEVKRQNLEHLLAKICTSLCLHLHGRIRKSFLKVRNYNLSFGSVILTIYFLYGLMEKKRSSLLIARCTFIECVLGRKFW